MYLCYVCQYEGKVTPVEEAEHRAIQQQIEDHLTEVGIEIYVNTLNLAHCQGPPECFDVDGATVICLHHHVVGLQAVHAHDTENMIQAMIRIGVEDNIAHQSRKAVPKPPLGKIRRLD